MNSRTKSIIKTAIVPIVQAVIFVLLTSIDFQKAGLIIVCLSCAVLSVAAVTLIFKVDPPHWIISTFFLFILLYFLLTDNGVFIRLEDLAKWILFLIIAVAETLLSIITVFTKNLVVHIRCKNRIKLIISDNECESAKKVYNENGVVNSFFLYNKIRKCCAAALDEENIKEKAEVSLTIVDNEEIRELNFEHRGKDSVTDVLSFPLGENGEFDVDPETNRIMLGDIVISAERAAEQAKEYGHTFEREMCFLATHSMFHLLGYDHEVSEEEEKIMFAKQEKVLNKLGINR